MRAAGLLVTDELDRGAAPSAGALLPATREATAAGQAPLTLLQLPAEVLVLVLCRLNTLGLARVATTCFELYPDKPAADEPRPMTPVEEALRQRAAARGHLCPDRLAEVFSSSPGISEHLGPIFSLEESTTSAHSQQARYTACPLKSVSF
jgi:hypothetical protein